MSANQLPNVHALRPESSQPAHFALVVTAKRLGYAGLVPFVGSALVGWLAPETDWRDRASLALVAYGAVILSFVGAVHWGVVLATPKPSTAWRLMVSVLPALLAWVSLMLEPLIALALQATGFFAIYRYEQRSAAALGLAPWYLSLRRRLSIVVVLTLVAGMGSLELR